MGAEIEKTADVLEDEKWDAKLKRERIEDEQRAIAATLSVNRQLASEQVEAQRETMRLDHEIAANRDAANHERWTAFNNARDRRVVWIEVVANASSLPIEDALARADRIVTEYADRFRASS